MARKSRGWGFLAGAVIAVLLGTGAYAFRREPVVLVAQAATGEIVSRVVASGTVEPSRIAEVTSRVSGVLVAFDLKEGQAVKQGQVIGRVDRSAYELALATARSNLLASQSQLARLERQQQVTPSLADAQVQASEQKLLLARSQLASQEQVAQQRVREAAYGVTSAELQLRKFPVSEELQAQVDHAKALLAAAQSDLDALALPENPARLQVALAEMDLFAARLDREAGSVLPQEVQALQAAVAAGARAVQKAEEDLAGTAIVAPFDGLVLQTHATRGTGLAAGAPLVTLADLETAVVAAGVYEADVSRVSVGLPAVVRSPADPALQFDGKVTAVAPRATRDSSNTTIVRTEITFGNTGAAMRAGMSADVAIDVARSSGVVRVPNLALQGKGSERYLFVLEGTQVHRRPVTTGAKEAAWVEITAGLAAGEWIVTGPAATLQSLRDGQSVRTGGQN
ncbi:MAG TPA: efflux RND transporter periplasmic adaptor subunit [Symbiobacteriaceae bacterium]|nr:efflux RND transporter periplasmic adaptor subunit [Symbiobacteriaceae bacterium]